MPRNQQARSKNSGTKSGGRLANQNQSNNESADMELTHTNRNLRSSVGPNRSRTVEQPSREANNAQQRGRSRKQAQPRRARTGVNALREIRRLQSTVHLLIPKLPFARLVRELLQFHSRNDGIRVTREAFMALQEASEMYLVQFFEDAFRAAIHAKRVTLMPRDLQLILCLRGNWGII